MDIQATISKLQSDIKKNATWIAFLDESCKGRLSYAKKIENDVELWRDYHDLKAKLITEAKQQKINKSLYKLMCTIQKQMPNGSVSMAQIREM